MSQQFSVVAVFVFKELAQSTLIFGKKQKAELKSAIDNLDKLDNTAGLVKLCVRK
jgi:hypothetical protein